MTTQPELQGDNRHLLVVDDDPRLRVLLQRFLAQDGYHVTTAEDAETAKDMLRRLTFDLLVVDVMMPGQDGFSLVRELRAGSGVPVLMLTARGEVEDRIEGLEAGADDYLVKPFEPRELSLRIGTILRRASADAHEGPAIIRFGPFTFDVVRRQLRRGDDSVRLTSGEAAMLALLAEQAGRPVARVQLAEAAGSEASDRAVDAQIVRLRRKIGDDPRQPRFLVTQRGEGYALVARD
jgi:two-component system phosphate regulon response regulator OmpR